MFNLLLIFLAILSFGDNKFEIKNRELVIEEVLESTNSIYPWSNDKNYIEIITLNDEIEVIPFASFSGFHSLREIQFPTHLKTIDKYAFYDSYMTKLDLKSLSIETIGESSFENNQKLEEIGLPDTLTRIENHAFAKCKSLKSIKIPNNVNYLGEGIFQKCINLERIEFGDKIETIEHNLFEDCKKLKEITIPESNEKIKSINNVIFDKDGLKIVYYLFTKTDTTYSIPDSVTSIGEYAFVGTNLETIEINPQLTLIENNGFKSNRKLRELEFPKGENELIIEENAFLNNVNLEKIEFNERKYTIGKGAFVGCYSLTMINYYSW